MIVQVSLEIQMDIHLVKFDCEVGAIHLSVLTEQSDAEVEPSAGVGNGVEEPNPDTKMSGERVDWFV